MKQRNSETRKDNDLAPYAERLSNKNGLSHEKSDDCGFEDWDITYTVTCTTCNKQFRSNCTFVAHVWGPRHRWKREQITMTSQHAFLNGSQATEEDILRIKDEGLAWTNDDPKKAAFLLSKAGKGLIQLNEIEKARECLQQALAVAEEFLKDRNQDTYFYLKDNDVFGDEMEREDSASDENLTNNNGLSNETDIIDFNRENNNVSIDVKSNTTDSNAANKEGVETDDEFRERSQTRPRIKRFKMEQMNRMYSDYKLQRGTADLYETMIQCYAESFDIDLSAGAEQNEEGSRQSIKLSEILMNRDLVLKELADTEKTYVDSLGFFVKTIIPAFMNAESQLIKDVSQGIFANIDKIYEWHSSVFIEEIEDCLEDPDLLGSTFKKHEKEITGLYEVYCQNKPQADDLLLQYADEIDQVFRTIQTSYTILDYLIKPVQRIMKYQLLLQSIFKYTGKMGENTESIQTALKVMEIVPKKVNDKMHLAMIIGYAKSLERDELVLQDTLNVSFDGGRAKPRKYRLFLFKDFLLFTEPIERLGQLPRYKFCLELKTCRMGVTQTVENDRLKFAIWSRKFKTTDIFVCTADTKEMKLSWLSALTNVFHVNGSFYSHDSTSNETKRSNKGPFRTKKWSAEQIVRQATIGHPREYSMSSKLKANIEKFLMEELCLGTQQTNLDSDNNNGYDVQLENSYLMENNSSKQPPLVEKFRCSSGEVLKSDDEKASIQGRRQGSLRLMEEENESKKNKKGFRLWRPNKRTTEKQEKLKTIVKSEKCQRYSLSDNVVKSTSEDFEVQESAVNDINTNENFTPDDNEIFECKSTAAEIRFLLVQNEASLSWEAAEQLLENSLELFYDVKSLKQIAEREKDHKALLGICESHHRSVRKRRNFKENTMDNRENFFSYRGLYGLLMTYADLSAENTESYWPIFLCSLATAAAKLENEWKDAFAGYMKLSQMYKVRNELELSVDCLVEAYQIKLSMNDVETAASCLKDALEVALIAGIEVKSQMLEAMATALIEKSKEMDIETSSLKLITEMSFAYKRHDYSWFNKNYHRICECEDYRKDQDNSGFRELLAHLLEQLKVKKHFISREVFV